MRIQTRSCKHIHEAFGTFCQVFQAAAFCPYASTIITKSAADSRSHLKLFTFVATPCDFGVVRIAAAKKKLGKKRRGADPPHFYPFAPIDNNIPIAWETWS